MRWKTLIPAFCGLLVAAGLADVLLVRRGFRAREEPTSVKRVVAHIVIFSR